MATLFPRPDYSAFYNPLFDHSAGTTLQVGFNPILRGYVTSDYQEGDILTEPVTSPVLFQEDLNMLEDVTRWKITYNPASDTYMIQSDDWDWRGIHAQFASWKANFACSRYQYRSEFFCYLVHVSFCSLTCLLPCTIYLCSTAQSAIWLVCMNSVLSVAPAIANSPPFTSEVLLYIKNGRHLHTGRLWKQYMNTFIHSTNVQG